MQIAPGTMVDRYHVIELVGEGGMAVVYKATDTRLKREVALKLIRSEVFPPAVLEQVLARFEREATSLARMQHPNILTVFDFGEYDGAPYLVSEYLAGGTLRQRMGGQIPPEQAARLLRPVAEALAYAHNVGVIHRDVKPANVLFTNTDTPKLADFGIARLLGMDASTQLTGTGMGMGTPAYMAPEQWHGDVSPAVDVYALGVVFFEMLTGRLPYEAQTPVELAIMMATKELPDPRLYAPHLPDPVVEILKRSLQTRPEDRYASMTDLVSALQDFRPASTISRKGSGLDDLDRTEIEGEYRPRNPVTSTEVDRSSRPFTPSGGIPYPTPSSPGPGWPAGVSSDRPPTQPPTYPPGAIPPRTTPPSAYDSGATFQTPASFLGGDKTTVQTPAGGQAFPTPPPYATPAPPAYSSPAGYPSTPATPKRRSSRSLLIGSVLLVLCCVLGGAAAWYGYQQYTARAFQAKVATGLAQTADVVLSMEQTAAVGTETARQATASAAAHQTEAAQFATAQAEATKSAEAAAAAATQAAIPVPLQGPLTWPVIYQDIFSTDSGDWVLGDDEDDFAMINRSIQNGTFVFAMTAKKGVASRTTPDVPATVNTDVLPDFYAAVDLVMSGPESMQGGLIFRYDKNSGYYSFIINRTGEYSLWSYDFSAAKWTNVVDKNTSNAISINGINHIEVVGRGDRYYIYVNRTLVVDTTVSLQSIGWVGFMCELSNNGDQGEWHFDNFVVRAP